MSDQENQTGGVMLTLAQAASWLEGAQLLGEANTPIKRVHTDTRSVRAGDLFVALKGERYDAHAFLQQAKNASASAIMAQADFGSLGLPGLRVADTRLALGQLAAAWRSQFRLPVVAVTGSNGKTTVTQMVASIFKAAEGEGGSHATQGNLNNDIGVPLTLLSLRGAHRYSVVELGMNHPGEIAYLAKMVRPTVALINNAQREHLEYMQTVEAVAHENAEVLSFLEPGGVVVLPADDVYTAMWSQKARARRANLKILTFGMESSADVTATAQWQGGAWRVQAQMPDNTKLEFSLHIAGRHNVLNALAALSCAWAAGVDAQACVQGLESFKPVKGRSCALQLAGGRTLVDDTYNANPDSMEAAIRVLAQLPRPRILVMGDMGEVGQEGAQFHREMGRLAHEAGIERVLLLGELAQHALGAQGATHFASIENLLAALEAQWQQAQSILVKGSRFMKMERVVDFLQALSKQHTHLEQGGSR